MNTIYDFLKSEEVNVRVSCCSRWLVWSAGYWIVYERKYGAKKTRTLIETKDEANAVRMLIGE